MRPHTKATLAVQLPIMATGTTTRRAKPVTKRVKTKAAMTPSTTHVTREMTRVAAAKARNRRIGRPARAV
jgi:hypothetical protein